MGVIVEGLGAAERERIASLRETGEFFWVDLSFGHATREGLAEGLGLPEQVVRLLLDFTARAPRSRKFYADGRRVVFAFGCYLERGAADGADPYRLHPVDVLVLVTGDYLLTLHEESASLSELLDAETPAGRSEQFAVYAVLDAMVATAFDALGEAELTLDRLQKASADLRAGRVRMATLRAVSSRLSEMRRHFGPQRGAFERISIEIGRIEGLEADPESYFERIGQQLNRLVEAVDAAGAAMATLIDLRLNETTYWLTVVATIFLPLTFLTGFFGMNFEWMVDQVDTPLAFFLLGIGLPAVGVALVWKLIVRGTPVNPDEDATP